MLAMVVGFAIFFAMRRAGASALQHVIDTLEFGERGAISGERHASYEFGGPDWPEPGPDSLGHHGSDGMVATVLTHRHLHLVEVRDSGILVITPLAFACSIRGMFADVTKWSGLVGALISGSLLVLILGSLLLS